MRFDKYLILGLMIAALAAAALLLVIFVLSLISWGIIFALLIILLTPVSYAAVKFYVKNDCYDFDDFFEALTEEEEKDDSMSSIC